MTSLGTHSDKSCAFRRYVYLCSASYQLSVASSVKGSIPHFLLFVKGELETRLVCNKFTILVIFRVSKYSQRVEI